MRRLPLLAALVCSWVGVAGASPAAPDYERIKGVSAEPSLPKAPDAIASWRRDCPRNPGRNTGLTRRATFPEQLGDTADLENLVDSVMCYQFDRAYIGGAAVAVVDGDHIAFSRGYGYSDVANQTRIDAARTMFRIGSISKLFTWTSIMQLSEHGLALDVDVNQYLKGAVTIPPTFAQPVTLKNLMTHTAGFEENIAAIGMAATEETLPSLEETIEHHVPKRVRPPATTFVDGEDAAYSNWGGALGGYIVAQQSGKTFDDYVDENIFQPLEMRSSTFRERVPPPLDSQMSTGYYPEDGYPVCSFEFLHGLGPAGSGSSSAEDMANFMISHLQGGTFRGKQILQETTERLMQSRVFSPHPNLAGGTYGFNEVYINGHRLLWHGGLTACFYAELYLFPDEKIGLFVAYNTQPLTAFQGDLAKRFMDHYFPANKLETLIPRDGDGALLEPFAGDYRSTSRSHNTWERLLDLTSAVAVTVTNDGILRAPRSPGSPEFADWVLVGPNVLRRADGEETIALRATASDKYILGPWPFAPQVKLHWLETRIFNDGFIGLCWLGFLLAIALVLVFDEASEWGPYQQTARAVALAGGVNLGILCMLYEAWRLPGDLTIAIPLPIHAAMTLSVASLGLLLWLSLLIAKGWRRPDWTCDARLGLTALALPNLAFFGWLCFWHLFGFQLG